MISSLLSFVPSFCYVINYGFAYTCHFDHHRLSLREFHSNENFFKTKYFYSFEFIKHKIPFVLHSFVFPIFLICHLIIYINVTNQSFFVLVCNITIIIFCHHSLMIHTILKLNYFICFALQITVSVNIKQYTI